MKTSQYNKQELINKLTKSGYKETSKDYWVKRLNRVEYSYSLKNWGFNYLEREDSLKEGWFSQDFKYKK